MKKQNCTAQSNRGREDREADGNEAGVGGGDDWGLSLTFPKHFPVYNPRVMSKGSFDIHTEMLNC